MSAQDDNMVVFHATGHPQDATADFTPFLKASLHAWPRVWLNPIWLLDDLGIRKGGKPIFRHPSESVARKDQLRQPLNPRPSSTPR